MNFYIDESGNTGLHLFDENQPILYYGILSSAHDLNEVAATHILQARARLSVPRLHAAELGIQGIDNIHDILCNLNLQHELFFDIVFCKKPDLAIISFFDQVFDAGLNPAITWTGYWTPLRYVLLLKLAFLFDEQLAKLVWKARIERKNYLAKRDFTQACDIILSRVHFLPDSRSIELISDAVLWAKNNFSEISYNCTSTQDKNQISPNLIGFQSCVHMMCRKLSCNAETSKVIVDQQSEFNKSQQWLYEYYRKTKDVEFQFGTGIPERDLKNIPDIPLEFVSSHSNIGLEIVDIYLWIFKRVSEGKEIPKNLWKIIRPLLQNTLIDGVSLDSIAQRWSSWLENLPTPSEEALQKGLEIHRIEEDRRVKPTRLNGT